MASYSVRTDPTEGEYTQVTVWAGPDAEHREYCGALMVPPVVAHDLVARLTGAGPVEGSRGGMRPQ